MSLTWWLSISIQLMTRGGGHHFPDWLPRQITVIFLNKALGSQLHWFASDPTRWWSMSLWHLMTLTSAEAYGNYSCPSAISIARQYLQGMSMVVLILHLLLMEIYLSVLWLMNSFIFWHHICNHWLHLKCIYSYVCMYGICVS